MEVLVFGGLELALLATLVAFNGHQNVIAGILGTLTFLASATLLSLAFQALSSYWDTLSEESGAMLLLLIVCLLVSGVTTFWAWKRVWSDWTYTNALRKLGSRN